MMDWSGWGAAGSLAMMIVMLLLVVLAVAGLVLLFRPVFRPDDHTGQKHDCVEPTVRVDDPLRQTEERYARGEIDRGEFLTRRSDLTGQS